MRFKLPSKCLLILSYLMCTAAINITEFPHVSPSPRTHHNCDTDQYFSRHPPLPPPQGPNLPDPNAFTPLPPGSLKEIQRHVDANGGERKPKTPSLRF